MENDIKNNEILAGTCLLLSIAHSDENLEELEIKTIKEIVIDFYNIKNDQIDEILSLAKQSLDKATDLFEFSRTLNNTYSYQDKIDFICCAFEVAYSDGFLHNSEQYFINKIANSLNVEHRDLINCKQEMKKYLK